ncbi:hypothetical protein EYB25_008480 [Talaromyces marneffei]|nr:hypothetical protein EYB25_008480 [Talaromyces marneffei]
MGRSLFSRLTGTPANTSANNQLVRHDDTQQSTDSSPAHVSFPSGIKVLHDCPDATIDICFVHGLTGNRESTWTAEGKPEPWPKALLPSEIGNARIITFGYDAYVVRASAASKNHLRDHADNLVNALTVDRARINASTRALIFVAHSLGGLVCKKALLSSRVNGEADLRGIFKSTKGIIFMGTPHEGSWAANWAIFPAKLLSLIKSTNINLLDTLGRVMCFYEELGYGPKGICFVSKKSATLAGQNDFSIHATHENMVKFASSKDPGFHMLCGVLVKWEHEIKEETAKALADQQQQQHEGTKRPGDANPGQSGNQHTGNTYNYNSGGGNQSGNTYQSGNTSYNSGSGHQFQGSHFNGNVRF